MAHLGGDDMTTLLAIWIALQVPVGIVLGKCLGMGIPLRDGLSSYDGAVNVSTLRASIPDAARHD